jgi:hypothetical protein
MDIEVNDFFIKLPYDLFTYNDRKKFIEEFAKKQTYKIEHLGADSPSILKTLQHASYKDVLEIQKKYQEEANNLNCFIYAQSGNCSIDQNYLYFDKIFKFLGFKQPYNFRVYNIIIFGNSPDGSGNIPPHVDEHQKKCSLNIPLEGDWLPSINWYNSSGNIIKQFFYNDNIAVVNTNKLHGVEGMSSTGRSHIRIKFEQSFDEFKQYFLHREIQNGT